MAKLLVTNDDGAASRLWRGLCDALEKAGHEVYGVAPTADQSWIATSQTLGKEVSATSLGKNRWGVAGTPGDCVGIAPLLSGKMFDAVVSGINIGVNTRLPMILTSGTVGAATLGSMMGGGCRAIAFSYAMPRELSELAKKSGGVLPQTAAATAAMMAHCVARVESLLQEPKSFGKVHNVNFPENVGPGSQWQTAAVAVTAIEQLFEKLPNGNYKHSPKFFKPTNTGPSEFTAIKEGFIAESVLDWSKLGALAAPASVL